MPTKTGAQTKAKRDWATHQRRLRWASFAAIVSLWVFDNLALPFRRLGAWVSWRVRVWLS